MSDPLTRDEILRLFQIPDDVAEKWGSYSALRDAEAAVLKKAYLHMVGAANPLKDGVSWADAGQLAQRVINDKPGELRVVALAIAARSLVSQLRHISGRFDTMLVELRNLTLARHLFDAAREVLREDDEAWARFQAKARRIFELSGRDPDEADDL